MRNISKIKMPLVVKASLNPARITRSIFKCKYNTLFQKLYRSALKNMKINDVPPLVRVCNLCQVSFKDNIWQGQRPAPAGADR